MAKKYNPHSSKTLADIGKKHRKFRQCPHCKSKKGFELRYAICGSGMVQMNFKGQTLDADRHVSDRNEHYVECLNCHKNIEIERVQTDFI